MRHIQLTHDQIDLLVNSLFIASAEYQAQFAEQAAKFPADQEAGQYWFNKANKIYDLATDIKNGKLDV